MNSRRILVVAAVLALPLLASCHRTQAVQRGYRGQDSIEIYSESTLRKLDELNKVPKPLKAANPDGPRAGEFYSNIHVVSNISKSQLARLMLSIKTWVAPTQGCNYCHNAPDYTNDDKYTKVVARRMLAMTRHINSTWTKHVGATGVTCFTCHRGQPVPAKLWYQAPNAWPNSTANGASVFVIKPGRPPTPTAHNTTYPSDPLTDYLLHDDNIRIVGPTALQSGNRRSIYQAQNTYSLMMVMAESLGVNCTFCHYTAAFYNWDMSTPQRATAWYGIRMVRDLNNAYMVPLTEKFPPERLGPLGDGPKIYCATCHQGSNKPLYGAPQIVNYPELLEPATPDATAPGATAPGALPPGETAPGGVSPEAPPPASAPAKTAALHDSSAGTGPL
jgi:photosynthetic reaction center cytochrome c subunit